VSEQIGPTILVVDDSPEDYETTVRAFRRAGLRYPMHHCSTGDEALDFLYRRGAFARLVRAPRPVMILLDLNLPGTDGRAVLHEIKRTPELARIPVVVLTTSTDRRDVDACYQAGREQLRAQAGRSRGFHEGDSAPLRILVRRGRPAKGLVT
jgi:CheY-like chemotaxis protein